MQKLGYDFASKAAQSEKEPQVARHCGSPVLPSDKRNRMRRSGGSLRKISAALGKCRDGYFASQHLQQLGRWMGRSSSLT